VAIEMCDGEPPFWKAERKDVYGKILKDVMQVSHIFDSVCFVCYPLFKSFV
jgi:hypothetical protein